MKKLFPIFLFCLFAITVLAQQKTTITGKFINCKDSVLELSLNNGHIRKIVKVNPDGTFNFSTTEITSPLRGNLTNRAQIQTQLLLAPGYQLDLTADVKDYQSFRSTLKYTGLGGKTNSYWTEVYASYKPDTENMISKDEDTYIAYIKGIKSIDEAIQKTFANNNEPYHAYFKQSLMLDAKFGNLLNIFSGYAPKHNYKWPQIEKMIAKLGYKPLYEEFNDEKNLSSIAFCYLLEQYPYLCVQYGAFPEDEAIKKQGNYLYILMSRLYQGKVYDYAAYTRLKSSLSGLNKAEEIKTLHPYIERIANVELKNEIKTIEAKRMKDISAIRAGVASPLFNLADTSGKFYQLAAMKGKVVYIDLWASWCGPCKQETPYLKKIYEQYKNNDKVEIISIASFDVKNRKQRYEIIKKDQMNWLQLEDPDDSFAKSYGVNSIPRFIIIDKEGKIVDSDAVRPSEPEKLMAILNREIIK